jgi:soluble lytic murein transglycosylase-like protein
LQITENTGEVKPPMSNLKTSRPFQERFLDGYDRSQLRQEVQKVKPKRLKNKYARWALGGAIALSGIGIPMKVGNLMKSAQTKAPQQAATSQPVSQQIVGDLQAAEKIATQVAGGVQGAVSTVAETAAAAPMQIAKTVAQAPQQVAEAAEKVRENFFKKEVPFGSLIYSEARKNDLAPELVAAVAHTESKFNPAARSRAGAIGLMQLVPRTGRWLGAKDLTNPVQNVMAGTKYLRYLNDQFHGNQEKVIAAYNAGEGNVRRFGGVPPFRETQQYLQRVRSFQHDLGQRLDVAVADVQVASGGTVIQ